MNTKRLMRTMNVNKVMAMLPNQRKKSRNKWLFSLLGLGLAGGAVYSMSKGKSNNSNKAIQNIMKQITNKKIGSPTLANNS
ncbi:hypothetical protein OEV98_08370 [Caldibacillus lycopersici]|uniref:Uncharacterized protein n=1 Tax=Perspicuibacillus lycopersici TaxID=1325689 RepID=A0AAE3LN77_9BACI|nr:hypothetical protein [Perspicuibacillus lycopersici]MCU9613572.1 hypothetical protein [Perspicuibacillus lycopersici]